jgi:ankyrin repeat protein
MEVLIPKGIIKFETLNLNQKFLVAASRGFTDIISDMLEHEYDHSFDPNCFDEFGFTALHKSCLMGFSEIINILINNNRINLNQLDKLGRHAMQLCLLRGDIENIIKIYIKLPFYQFSSSYHNVAFEYFKNIFCYSKQDILGSILNIEKLDNLTITQDFNETIASNHLASINNNIAEKKSEF